MKKLIYIIALVACGSSIFTACSGPDEMTPKTKSNAENKYLLPTGTILTADERAEVQAQWDEYNSAINQ